MEDPETGRDEYDECGEEQCSKDNYAGPTLRDPCPKSSVKVRNGVNISLETMITTSARRRVSALPH